MRLIGKLQITTNQEPQKLRDLSNITPVHWLGLSQLIYRHTVLEGLRYTCMDTHLCLHHKSSCSILQHRASNTVNTGKPVRHTVNGLLIGLWLTDL